MSDLPASLVELATRFGVATEYQDWTGRHSVVAESTLVAVLDALGVAAATEDERHAALAAHDRDYWTRSLPPTIVGSRRRRNAVLGARHPRRSCRAVGPAGGRERQDRIAATRKQQGAL